MKLNDALETAVVCGLETVDEAVNNITRHAMNLFGYDKVAEEILELQREAAEYPEGTLVRDILGDAKIKEIDRELEENLAKCNEELEA